MSGWSLRRRMAVLSTVVAVLLTLLAALAAGTAAVNRDRVTAVVDVYSPLRADAEKLLAALVNQETGIRGYALSGEPEDLTPYTEGIREETALSTKMHRDLAGQPAAQARLVAVGDAAARWRARVADPIIAAVRSGGREAAEPLVIDGTRLEFGVVRARVADFQQEIQRIRNLAADEAKRSSGIIVLLLIVATSIVVVVGIALVLLQERLIARPVTALAADVRQVARGLYDHEIRHAGPPELADLARDVDVMRRQIVRDLARLQEQAAELTRSNRDLEQFAYVASHDLQEPLRKVVSFCQLLQRRYAGQLDERADQYIAYAVNGAQRMQRLVNDLLAFSRIGRAKTGFTDVDLDQVLRETVSALDTLIARTNAEVTWSDLPVVPGEESLLSTLVSNLVGNSLKFRRPDAAPRVHISARCTDGEWEISFTDNGIGIEPEFADKVFVIFQRLHPKDAYTGTGIGLAVAKKIVEYHGGRIWVDSGAEVGTTIRLTLPAADDEDPDDEDPEEEPPDEGPADDGPAEAAREQENQEVP